MPYTASVTSALEKNIPFLHKNLSKKHFLIFFGKCMHFFGKSYLRSLFLCRYFIDFFLGMLFTFIYTFLSLSARFYIFVLFLSIFLSFLWFFRNLTKTGAQQFLLDIYSIKSFFGRFADELTGQSTKMILKRIVKDKMAEMEAHLKVLSADELTMDTFMAIFPNGSSKSYQKITLISKL